jgi:LysM repeat protein
LAKVAKRFGMDPKALGQINGLKKNATLRHGQRIKLVSAKVNTASASNHTLTDISKTRPGKPVQTTAVSVLDSKKAKAPAPVFYTVGRGDKLAKIAKETGIAVETLCQINGIKKNAALRPGQKLQLAYAEPATKTVSTDVSSKLPVYRPQTLSKASAPAPAPTSHLPAKAVSTTKQAAFSPKSTSGAKVVTPAPKTATSAKAASKGKSSPAAVAAIATGPSKMSAGASKAAPAAKSASTSAAKTAPPTTKSSPSVAAKNSSNTSGKPSKNSTSASPSKTTGSAKPMKEARR